MSVIRRGLEAHLGQTRATLVLFAALDEEDGYHRDDPEAAVAFLKGPLRQSIASRFGRETADAVVSDLEAQVAGVDVELDAEDPELETQLQRGADGPIRVVTIARSPKLTRRLEAAFGPERLSAADVRDLAVLATSAYMKPRVIIVDGVSAPDLHPEALAEALAAYRGSPLVVVWAADQPWGSAVRNALRERDLEPVAVPRAEGVEPLLDYLRAQMTSS